MSRVKKTIKNAKVGVVFFSLTLLAQFFSRKIFLESLGDEFIGLTSTLQSILGFLNLAELGIGTAVGVTLYKPLFKNDYDEINNIIALVGILYKKIGIVVIVLGTIVAGFFPIIFSETEIRLPIIYFAFVSFLTSSLVGYFITYQIIILQADQKSYIVSTYFHSFTILKLIIQSILVFYYKSYFLWIILEFIFPLIYSYILKLRIKKEYNWLSINSLKTKPKLTDYTNIIKIIKQTFVHKIGSFVLFSTDQLLIFALVNLKSVAFFGNYQLIFSKLNELTNSLFAGIDAGIGNLVAENDSKKIDEIFWEMMALRFLVGGFICINLYFLTEPFIVIWLGNQYILDRWILLLMLINLFISQIRTPVEQFKNAYALFWDIWAPIVEVIINLMVSLIFGILWGIKGIMFGTLISLLVIVVFWKPYFLYRYGFKKGVQEYWMGFLKLLVPLIFFFIISQGIMNYFFHEPVNNYLDWLLLSIKISLISLFIYIPFLLTNKGFRNLINRFNRLLKKTYK